MAKTVEGKAPDLSMIVVGRDGILSLHPIITCLAEQTIADRIEVIAVLPKDEDLGLHDAVVNAFFDIKAVAAGPFTNRGEASSHGVPHTRGRVIGFFENHCFPDPDWAEITLRHYDDETVSGVAPIVENGNPEWGLSWACYSTGYASLVTDTLKEVEGMPNHNTTYRASELKRRENRLLELLKHESALQGEIRAEGGRFLTDPAARTKHLNEGTWWLSVGINFVNGRMYGAKVGPDKSWSERIARAIAFPLAAAPILRNNLNWLANVPGPKTKDLQFYTGLIAMSLARAFGEACGYLAGMPDHVKFLEDEEFMVTERLGKHTLSDPRLAGYVALVSQGAKT